MRSVESIPVYHDSPRRLMQTFRETTAAMQAVKVDDGCPGRAVVRADGNTVIAAPILTNLNKLGGIIQIDFRKIFVNIIQI